MKLSAYIGLSIFFLLMGCSDHKQKKNDAFNDNIGRYIALGGDRKLPNVKRIYYNNKVLPILLQQENDSLNSDAILKVAGNFSKLFAWKDLKRTSEIVLKKSLLKNNNYFIGQSYRWLGVYYVNVSINDSAFYFFSKAERIHKRLKNHKELCQIYIDKALVQYYVCDYLGSETSVIKALKIAKNNNLIDLQADCYFYLNFNSNELQNYKSAIDYSTKALELCKKNQKWFDPSDIAFSLNQIAYSYYRWGKIEESINYYNLAIKKDKHAVLYPSAYSMMLDNYANVKLKFGDYKDVEKIHINASNIRDSLNIDQGRNINKRFLSEYYQATNQIPKAKQFAHEAYTLSKSYRNAGDMLASLKQLSKVDTQNALKYSQEYIQISDSMQQLERVTRNKFAKIAYETEEITTEKDEAIQQKWIFFGLAVLVFIIGALVVLLLMQRAKQKELRFLQEQQKTNEEIYQLIQNQQSKIDEARHIEKKRIARDLHDGIMNRLSSTRLNLHILNEKATPEIIRKCLPFIAGIQDIEKEIRNVSHNLNKDALFNKVSFVAVIESFVAEQKEHFKVKCHLEIDPTINWEWLTSFQKINIFRILQEAFQNTNKHAQAQNIIISFLKSENQLLLEIFDDGVGFSFKQKKKGIGLQNIYSRAKQCNGKAEIKSDLSTGTTLTITLPFNPIL